jgi:hypothetical protein
VHVHPTDANRSSLAARRTTDLRWGETGHEGLGRILNVRRGVTVLLCALAATWMAPAARAAGSDGAEAQRLLDELIDGGTSLDPDSIDRYVDLRGPLPTVPPPLMFHSVISIPAVFPVAGPHAFTDSFGAPRSGERLHQGIDIFADKGVPVVAMADGVVEWVRRQPDTRCCAIGILHDDGWRTWYLHLNNDSAGTDDGLADGVADSLEVGVRVLAGQTIGWVGDSGNAEETPAHLHIEIRLPDGTVTNPYASLTGGALTPGDGSIAAALPFTGWDGTSGVFGTLLLMVAGVMLTVAARDRLRQATVTIAVERPDGSVRHFILEADQVLSAD